MADIHIFRDFNVSPARLFEAITTDAQILQWWGHDGMDLSDTALDFTRTGPWHAVMIGADGARYHMSGQVTHVRPPVSVGFTWGWHDAAGVRGEAESHVTFTVGTAPGGARLTIDHRDLPADVAARHEKGWGGPMARLARLLDG